MMVSDSGGVASKEMEELWEIEIRDKGQFSGFRGRWIQFSEYFPHPTP